MSENTPQKGTLYTFSARKMLIGIGWDLARRKFVDKMAGVFAKKKFNSVLDVDLSLILCGKGGRVLDLVPQRTCVYYENTTMYDGAIVHGGDNVAKEGEDSNESIIVDFERLPNQLGKMVVVASIKDAQAKQQHFGQSGNGYITIIDADNRQEVCHMALASDFANMTGILAFEIVIEPKQIKIKRIGQGLPQVKSIKDLITQYT